MRKTNMADKPKRNDLSAGLALGALGGAFGVNAMAGTSFINEIEAQREPWSNIEAYTKKHKELGKLKNEIVQTVPQYSHLNPSTGAVHTGNVKAIAAHELGHAENVEHFKKMFGEKAGKTVHMLQGGRFLIAPMATFGTVPLLFKGVTDKLKGKNEKSFRYKTFDTVEKHPEYAVGASVLPQLSEEAAASMTGLKRMKQIGSSIGELSKAKKLLTTAFVTHASAAALPVAAAALLGVARRDRQYRENKKK